MSSSPQRSPKSAVIGTLRNSGIVSEDSTLPAKPGDASIAAPFVYRGDTIRCVTLLVRSGRAALALVIQMYKILAVNSLITAFSLSVMTLRGVKLGDSQTAVEAVLMSIVSFMFSRFPPAKNLPTGTKFQPVSSVFRPSVMMSIFGQSLLHLALLAHGQFQLLDQTVETIDLDAKFSPSLANTIAFLQLWSAHLSSMVANFEGPPSLPSLQSSRPVVVLVGSMIITILLLSSGLLSGDFLELVEIENEVAMKLVMLVLGHIAGGICIGVGIRNFFERP
jgi:cation-transporting ATPase 13A1